MATIICRGVTFGYDGSAHNVFEKLELVLDVGWRCALVGRNGRGKSTLLKLLDGQLSPDRGAIEARAATRYFPEFPADTTVDAFAVAKDGVGPFRRWERELDALLDQRDEASLIRYTSLQERYQAMGGYQVDARLERELMALDVPERLWRRPFKSLSGGEQTRVLLASLFAGPDDYPLIDEPTNHLDRTGRGLLGDYLRAKNGFLLVSHDRAFLDACIDHVVALNPETVEVRRTTFSVWRAEFRRRLAAQATHNALLRKEIDALTSTARQRRAGAAKREATKAPHTDKGFIGARAARQMKRAISAERRANAAAEARRATLLDTEKDAPLKVASCSAPPSVLVTATNVSISRGRTLFAPVSFTVEPGDRVALVGRNGSGKTSLLDLIAGVTHPHRGDLRVPGHIRIHRAHQRPRWRSGSLQARLAESGIDETRFRQVMAALGVRGRVLEHAIEHLSDGQRKKLDLARAVVEPADLQLWDEPLNYVDLDARERIEEALLNDRPTVVFVEHDAAFVDAVATKIVELEPP